MPVGNPQRGLLRCYPAPWRARYQEEMLAMIDDTLGGESPSLRFCLAIARAGLAQRMRGAGVVGEDLAPSDQSRAGSLLVLCAWSCFVFAGIIFAKFSEHWQDVTPPASRRDPAAAFTVLQVSAAISTVVVVAGGLAAAPALTRFVRDRGWSEIRRPLLRAAISAAALAAATVALVFWAHHLGSPERHHVPWSYGLVFVGWGLLGAFTLACATAALVATARRLDLSATVLGLESALATAVASGMVLMTVATAVWWAMIASRASWVLNGGPAGTKATPWSGTMLLTALLMLGACAAASMGLTQIRRAAVRHGRERAG